MNTSKKSTVTFDADVKEHDGKWVDDFRNRIRALAKNPVDWSKVPDRLKARFKRRGFKKRHFNIPSVRKLLMTYLHETGYC